MKITSETMLSMNVGQCTKLAFEIVHERDFGGIPVDFSPYIVQEPEGKPTLLDADEILCKHLPKGWRYMQVKNVDSMIYNAMNHMWSKGYEKATIKHAALLLPAPEKADWTKDCECGPERIGESWCCNQCGRMVKRTEPEGKTKYELGFTGFMNPEAALEGKSAEAIAHKWLIKRFLKQDLNRDEEEKLLQGILPGSVWADAIPVMLSDYAATQKTKPGDYNDEYTMKLKEIINHLEAKCNDCAASREKVEWPQTEEQFTAFCKKVELYISQSDYYKSCIGLGRYAQRFLDLYKSIMEDKDEK